MIKPVINENNYQEYFKLKDNSCFIPNFITLSDVKGRWHRLGEASMYNMKGQGVEAESQLPKYDDAVKHFNKHGLKVEPLHFDQIYGEKKLKYCRSMHDFIEYFRYKIKAKKQRHKPVHLQYPLVGSYSDIFVVSSDAIRLFCHYCGVFASTNLFVELGLPTAMVLCAENIVQEKDLDFYGIGLWNEEDWKRSA